MGNIPL